MSLQQAEVERVPRTNKQIPQLDAKKNTPYYAEAERKETHYTMIQKQAEDLENRLLLELETGLVASFVTEVNLWRFNP
jgi:hypothetical protein